MRTEHENFTITRCGLCINSEYPYIGASPDGFVKCDCCGEGLVEIKCPFTAKDHGLANILYLCDGKLKDSHKYAYQVQTQLLDYCDFVAWSPSDIFVQRIEPDIKLGDEIVEKSQAFFTHAVLPELTGSLISRERLHKQTPRTGPLFSDVCPNGPQSANQHPKAAQPLSPVKISTQSMWNSSVKSDEDISQSDGASQELRCVCVDIADKNTECTVKCANENCPHGFLHFKCISIKRKPKPPYYCPSCGHKMWK